MDKSSLVTLEVSNQIAYVTLNRADKMNALNIHMFLSIKNVIKTIRKDANIRAVIVKANGEDFCSGLDVKAIMSKPKHMLTLLKKLLPGNANLAQVVSFGWRKLNVPVIMVINGRCWGGGLQIALGADFRFANTNATFSVMESKWGLIPDMAGNLALRELVAKDVALKLCMTAEVFDAEEAKNYGLLTGVSSDPLNDAVQLAEQIVEKSPDAIASIKSMYHQLWNAKDWRWLAKESWLQIKIIMGKNQKIAVKKQLSPEKEISYRPYK